MTPPALKPSSKLHNQRGAMMLNMSVAMMVLFLVAIGMARSTTNTLRAQVGQIISGQLITASNGLAAYIAANAVALSANTAIAGVAVGRAPAMSELKALNFINANVQSTPSYGSAYNFAVVVMPAGCSSNCQLIGEVYLSSPIYNSDGKSTDIKILGAASAASAAGLTGYSMPATPTLITGPGWTMSNPDSLQRAGILMATTGQSGQTTNDYLYRDVQGSTSLNTMNTPLIMNSFQTEGGACTNNGAIALSSNPQTGKPGILLSCQTGIWVSNTSCRYFNGDLNTLNGSAGSYSCVNSNGSANSPNGDSGDWWFVESINHVSSVNGNYWTTQRATNMTGWNGQLAQVFTRGQQAGSISGSTETAWGPWSYLLTVNSSGNATISGTMTAGSHITTNTAAIGAACSTNGATALNNSGGGLMACQSGVWISVTGDCAGYTGGDLNSAPAGGGNYFGTPHKSCVYGGSMGNAPTGDWYFVDTYKDGGIYGVQVARAVTGSYIGLELTRTEQNGSWTSWVASNQSGQWSFNSSQATSGGSCSGVPSGTIAKDSSGNLYVCR